jgi:outer membrane protein OmpA-like peptidoglycan-associated protein
MKKVVLGLIVLCAIATNLNAQTYKNSLSVLGGSSALWLTNSATESGIRPVYSHGGLQVTHQVKPNIEVVLTGLGGYTTSPSYNAVKKGVDMKYLSAGLGLRYSLSKPLAKIFTPFASLEASALARKNTTQTNHNVDVIGSAGLGLKAAITKQVSLVYQVSVGSPFYQTSHVGSNAFDARGSYFLNSFGISFAFGADCNQAKAATKVSAPVDVDTDGDGVVDRLDQCPGVFGTVANNGCVDPALQAAAQAKMEKEAMVKAEATVAARYAAEAKAKAETEAQAKQAAETKAVEEQKAKQQLLQDRTLIFNDDSALILPAAKKQADEVVEALKQNPTAKVKVEGHTDNYGTKKNNVKVSRNRAARVSQYLKKQGIESSRIASSYYGESKPAHSNRTKAGKKLNRRVEIKVVQ